MDAILNPELNDDAMKSLATRTSNQCFAKSPAWLMRLRLSALFQPRSAIFRQYARFGLFV